MFACLDESGRMYVAESSGLDLYAELQKLTRRCRISVLEDKDGDGVFESAKVFAEELVFPMGLCWREGKLYVADPPELVTLEDTNGDGRADKRTVVLSGFGHTDNGSLHGLTFGPDGWLYMTMGQPDGYKLTSDDGSFVEGGSGALIRCRPDGSGVEMVSRGFENLVEIDFMPAGEIVGTDNWFTLPVDGIRDALVHLVEGGLYPHQLKDVGTRFFRGPEPLPAIKMYPAVAHSGMARYRGREFQGEMRDDLFVAQFNTRKVTRHKLTPHESTFESSDADFVTTEDPDFHPSDVLEGADGSLYVVDTGSWYVHHCPTGRIRKVPAEGGIYRVRYDAAPHVADPWGRSLNWQDVSEQTVFERAGDKRRAVRARAIEELVRRRADASEQWEQILQSEAREEAVWALGRIGTEKSLSQVKELLGSSEEAVVTLAARVLGRIKEKSGRPKLELLLLSERTNARLAAAEALAHCGSRESVAALVQALEKDSDRFLEHALAFALYQLTEVEERRKLLQHRHPRVQRTAMVLLEQTPGEMLGADSVARAVFHEHEPLARTAREMLARHPEWIEHAAGILRNLLGKPDLTDAERGALEQFLPVFGPQPQVISTVAKALRADSEAGNATRMQLVRAIARTPAEKVPKAWMEPMADLLRAGPDELRWHVLQTVVTLRIGGWEERLGAIANDTEEPVLLRLEALRGLVRTRPRLSGAQLEFLWSQAERSNPAGLRVIAMDILAAGEMDHEQLGQTLEVVNGDPLLSTPAFFSLIQRTGVSQQSERPIVKFVESNAGVGEGELKWLEEKVSAAEKPRIGKALQSKKEKAGKQQDRLEQLEKLLTGGDYNRGHELFLEKLACVSCHQVGKIGGLSGPDLTKIGAIRSGRDLLESLLMPSATFAQGYDTFVVRFKDETEVRGVRVRHADESIVIRDAAGVLTRVEQAQVDSITRSEVSLMPEGLLDALKESEIQDLLAYLQSLK